MQCTSSTEVYERGAYEVLLRTEVVLKQLEINVNSSIESSLVCMIVN